MYRSEGSSDGLVVDSGGDRSGRLSPDGATAHHVSRRARILEEALATVLAGGDEVNIRLVAARSDVAVGTLYGYFPSKEHLLVSVLGCWLEGFGRRIGRGLYSIEDPYHRLCCVVEELAGTFGRAPQLATAMARAYVVADPSLAVQVEAVRSQLIELFGSALCQSGPTASHLDVGGLLTDVLASNLLALTQGRAQLPDVQQRLLQMAELLANRHGAAIGRKDWSGTRGVSEQSADDVTNCHPITPPSMVMTDPVV